LSCIEIVLQAGKGGWGGEVERFCSFWFCGCGCAVFTTRAFFLFHVALSTSACSCTFGSMTPELGALLESVAFIAQQQSNVSSPHALALAPYKAPDKQHLHNKYTPKYLGTFYQGVFCFCSHS